MCSEPLVDNTSLHAFESYTRSTIQALHTEKSLPRFLRDKYPNNNQLSGMPCEQYLISCMSKCTSAQQCYLSISLKPLTILWIPDLGISKTSNTTISEHSIAILFIFNYDVDKTQWRLPGIPFTTFVLTHHWHYQTLHFHPFQTATYHDQANSHMQTKPHHSNQPILVWRRSDIAAHTLWPSWYHLL